MAAENIAHRLIREPVTQLGHGAYDPVISPPGIFLRNPYDPPLGFLVNSGPSSEFAELRFVELELSVPGQQRIRLRHSRQFFQGGFPSLPVGDLSQRSFFGIG
jgi:hypothetical protein